MRIRIKVPTKKKIIMHLIALFLVGMVVWFALQKEEKTIQYDIVVLGDSIVGNVGEEGESFTTYLGENLNKRIFKGGIGGTTMSLGSSPKWSSISNVEWSMVKLAEAICYDDWKNQKATMAYAESFIGINNQVLSYFGTTMDTLSKIDFTQAQILVIGHGTNDYNSGKAVDNPKNHYDKTTFGGALRYSLKILKETYPHLRIVLLSPLYCELGEEKERKCYNTKYGKGGYLEEYVSLEKQIAGEFGVEWIDAYQKSGINEKNSSFYLSDGLHLNAEGHKLMGDFLTKYFEAN